MGSSASSSASHVHNNSQLHPRLSRGGSIRIILPHTASSPYDASTKRTNLANLFVRFCPKKRDRFAQLTRFHHGIVCAHQRGNEILSMVAARSIHNNALQHRTGRSLLFAALRDRMVPLRAWGNGLSRRLLAARTPGYLTCHFRSSWRPRTAHVRHHSTCRLPSARARTFSYYDQ